MGNKINISSRIMINVVITMMWDKIMVNRINIKMINMAGEIMGNKITTKTRTITVDKTTIRIIMWTINIIKDMEAIKITTINNIKINNKTTIISLNL